MIPCKYFHEVEDYDEMVVLRNVRFGSSYREHHIAPIIDNAHVAYLSDKIVLGISKLCSPGRALLQTSATPRAFNKAQIATIFKNVLQSTGVGVVVEASHGCMTTRRVEKAGLTMVTSQMMGAFREGLLPEESF